MSEYNLYLGNILRTIKLIESSGLGEKINYSQFVSDRHIFDATAMRFQIIGESLGKLSTELLNRIKGVDVKRFLQTRNIVSHAYFAINEEIIWSIAIKDIPKLKKAIFNLMKNF